MESIDFCGIALSCEKEYHALCERLGPLITIQKFISMKNPSWSEDEVTYWTNIIEEGRAQAARWREAWRNPTPIRGTQCCYSCKVPWEPDHRCRGKGKKHIIEMHYDSEDEACEDGSNEAYLGQSNDDSDSGTEASDSDSTSEDSEDDSFTEASDADPCVVDRQLYGQDDSTSVSADIPHTIDDLTPQQSGDTSEGSHVLASGDDELPMGVVTHLSPVQTHDSHIT
jgi:hypothetical protein